MRAFDRIGATGSLELASRGLQLALGGLLVYGTLAGKADLLVNGALALAISFVPELLAYLYDHDTDPRLALWITVAVTIHTFGMLGPYDAQSGLWAWYDRLAHIISAGFIAGVGYALLVALDRRSRRIRFPDGFRFVFTLCFIMAVGVTWEIIEFAAAGLAATVGGTEVLVQYGVEDTVGDLVANAIAAGLVVLYGSGYFASFIDLFSRGILRYRRS